ncbi:MAG TPA: glycosyltransferase family 1 protein [Paludibacter sp.]|jgi:glycosyltransferase involved in cell wall biosynthesis|nr:glycosyltransferase family 1 protein [Paludibacter sp.]
MMDIAGKKRLRLGILFYFSSKWMGGIIYIGNLIKTLDFLDDYDKPEILLFYKPENEKFINEIKYPYLTTIRWIFPSILWGNLKSILLRKNIFVNKILEEYDLDAIYPILDFPVRTRTKTKLISWWADLQHKHYPEFFSKKQIAGRNLRIKFILKNCDYMVLSSNDVLSDFRKFFVIGTTPLVHIYHFVSVIDNHNGVDGRLIREKYNLPEKYFLISNQFHKHKNHRVVLLAIANLKKTGKKLHIACTGKLPSASFSPYMEEIHHIIRENEIQDQVTMLGVISRSDQIQIMRHSQAVIQPSLFEGWSTVIEDAKSLQVPVIASDLKVNIEQLGNEGCYFSPHNPDELASILASYPARNLEDIFYMPYEKRVKEGAETLLRIFMDKS